jgi:hypothetical protein
MPANPAGQPLQSDVSAAAFCSSYGVSEMVEAFGWRVTVYVASEFRNMG